MATTTLAHTATLNGGSTTSATNHHTYPHPYQPHQPNQPNQINPEGQHTHPHTHQHQNQNQNLRHHNRGVTSDEEEEAEEGEIRIPRGRNKKRKQSRPIRIPCSQDGQGAEGDGDGGGGGGVAMAPLNLSNHRNGPDGTGEATSLPFYGVRFSHAPPSASTSPSSSSNSSGGGGGRRGHFVVGGAADAGEGRCSGGSGWTGSGHRIFNPEAYCDLCNKEFCNKYFLKTHKANKHGVYSSEAPAPPLQHQINNSITGSINTIPNLINPATPTTPGFNEGGGGGGRDSFCHLCSKDFCNKYFLRRHRAKIHGLREGGGGQGGRTGWPTTTDSNESMEEGETTAGERRHQSRSRGTSSSSSNAATEGNGGGSAPPPAAAPAPGATVGSVSGGAYECALCSHSFPSIYLLHMHTSYFHSSASTDSSSTAAYLGLKFSGGPSPSPPTGSGGGGAVAPDDDLRRLQSMILELSGQAAGGGAMGTAGGSSVLCPLCGKEFYSSYFLSQHIATAHTLALPLPPPLQQQQQGGGGGGGVGVGGLKDGSTPFYFKREEGGDEEVTPSSDMMVMMMMMGSGSGGAAGGVRPPSRVLGGGVREEQHQHQLGDQEEANNNTRERNGHKKSRPPPRQHVQEQRTCSPPAPVVTPVPVAQLTPKTTKPVSPSLSRSYCTICHKELCNKYFMRTHMLKMHGINIESSTGLGGVTCDICHKELCSKYFLKVHKQNTHGIVDDLPLLNTPNATTPTATPPHHEQQQQQQQGEGAPNGVNVERDGETQNQKRMRGVGGKWVSNKRINGGGVEDTEGAVAAADEDEEPALKNPHEAGAGDPLSLLGGSGGGKLYCRFCSYSTSLLVYLYAHERSHGGPTLGPQGDSGSAGVLQCPLCYSVHTEVDSFQQHLLTHHQLPSGGGGQEEPNHDHGHRLNNNNDDTEFKGASLEEQQHRRPQQEPRTTRRVRLFKCSRCGARFGAPEDCQSHITSEHKQVKKKERQQAPRAARPSTRKMRRRTGAGASRGLCRAFPFSRRGGGGCGGVIVQRFLLEGAVRGDECEGGDITGDENDGHRHGNFVVDSRLVPSVVYLPVRSMVSGSVRVSLTPQ